MKVRNVIRKCAPAPLRALVHDWRGEGSLDRAMWIVITIVLAGLFLGFLYLLFNNTLFPTVTQKLQDMFNYTGS